MQNAPTSDIIIVGAGIAGMAAANRAAQLGLKATVLEQGCDENTCATRAIPAVRFTCACVKSRWTRNCCAS